MSNDYNVKSLSNEEVHKYSVLSRRDYSVDNERFVDVVTCIESGWVWTVVGKKRLVVEILPDSEMGADDGVTIINKNHVLMRFKASVWRSAREVPGSLAEEWTHYRARWTLAHELGHAVLNHDRGVPMARATGVNFSTKKPDFIPPFKSAEHQANEFAGGFLIERDFAKELKSARDISITFGVSQSAASLFLDKNNAAKKSENVKIGFDNLKGLLSSPPKGPAQQNQNEKFQPGKCPNCGDEATFPTGGNKSHCVTCSRTMDSLADGDSLDYVTFD